MDSLIFTAVFAVLLCASVVDGQTGGTGQACNTGSTCSADNTDVCESNYCKRKVGATCVSPNQNQCVLGAQCNGTTTTCTCSTPYYMTNITDATKCSSSQNWVGGTCSGTDKGSCLDTNALCSGGFCTCKTGYARKTDTNTCSACSMMTLSVTLMLLVLIATSRFL